MSEKTRDLHDRRTVHLTRAIAGLPDCARLFVEEYRRPIELCGRAGPGGCQLDLMEKFVADVRTLLVRHQDAVTPKKVLDLREGGSGA